MSVLLIWSGPDTDGLTAKAKNRLKSGLESGGESVEEIHLNHKEVQTCRACGRAGYGTCRKDGTCVLKDDLQDIYRRMIQSDALVFVTPVYWHDMSENLKTLLDRVRRMETSCNGYLRGKHALLAACAGGTGRGTTEALSNLAQVLSHMDIESIDRLSVNRFNAAYMIPAAFESGKNFAANHASFRINGYEF